MQGDKYDAIWQNIWRLVKTYENMDVSQVDAFFSRVQLQAFSQNFVMLTADTPFIKRWIESCFLDVIGRALTELYGEEFTIAIEVDETSKTAIPGEPPSAPVPPSESASEKPDRTGQASEATASDPAPAAKGPEDTGSLGVASGYSFDGFVVGTSNRMAYSMAVAVAETPGQRDLNPLFIYGRSGLGKTHLLRSVQNYADQNFTHMKTLYVDTMELVNDYTNAAASGSNRAFTEFKKRYENVDMLLIDDVQGLQNKKETLNMVFQILNRMIDNGKQVVLSADRAPRNIDIDERYQSRFNSGGTCDIQPPEFETKLGIIRNYIEECRRNSSTDFAIGEDVQSYIAHNSSSNIRELKSAITKVIFEIHSNGTGEISTSEVRKLLANHFSGGAMHRPTIASIQKVVEDYYNVSHAELVGRKRSANITAARQVAIYLCRTLIDIPHSSVGKEFNRDHSTVIYSIRVVEEKLKESREFNEVIELLRQMILEG